MIFCNRAPGPAKFSVTSLKVNVIRLFSVRLGLFTKLPATPLIVTLPAIICMGPAKVLAALRIMAPVPVLKRPAVPEITLLTVNV